MDQIKKVLLGLLGAVLVVTMLSMSGCNPWGGNDDDTKNPPKPAPIATGYEITVYNGATASKVEAESYTLDSDAISYQLKGDKTSPAQTAKGAWVVKHRSWKAAAGEQRYEVTLFSGGKAVGSWKVHGFSTDSQSVLLIPADGSEVLRVCGDVVVKTIKPGKAEKATSKVTVYNGDSAVYQLELASSIVVGKHLQGEAADGSGTVWIWGNYKDIAFVR